MLKIDVSKIELAQAKECLTIKELSDRTGITRVWLSKIIKGETSPKAKTIGIIAKALNVDVREIIIQE